MNAPYPVPTYGRVNYNWINEAWQLYSMQAGTWVLSVLIYGILIAATAGIVGMLTIPGLITASVLTHAPATLGSHNLLDQGSVILAELAVAIATAVVGAFFVAGLFIMANKQVRGQPIGIGDLFSGGSVVGPVLGYSLLFSLILNIGVRLCIVPGLIVGALWWPGYAVVADGQGFGAAFSGCPSAISRDFGNALLFTFVWTLIILVSAIPCGLGLLITVPMSHIIGSLMYRDMIGMPGVPSITPNSGMPYPGQPTPGAWPPPPSQSGQTPYGQPPAQGQPPYGSPPASGPYYQAPQPPSSPVDGPAAETPPPSWPAQPPADDQQNSS